MKILKTQKDISFNSKFVRNPITQTPSGFAKTKLLDGFINNDAKIFQGVCDTFSGKISEIENSAQSILENNPRRQDILNIIRSSDEESKKSQLEFLKHIKEITLSDNELSYLLRLLRDNFPKESIIAKVWGLCVQNGLDIYTLNDSTYSIDKDCAINILNKNLIEKFKDSPKQALLMSRFNSYETMEKVSGYINEHPKPSIDRMISKLPAHDDKLTNSTLDLIYRFEKFVDKNIINKSSISWYELDMTSYWKGSTFTLEDIISKNNVLDIIEKKADIGSSLYYVTDILNRTEKISETVIASILQRDDISLVTANKIVLSMNNENAKFIHSLCTDKSIKIKPESFMQYIETFNLLSWISLDFEKLKLSDKINILKKLQSVPAEMKPIYAKFGYDTDYCVNTLNKTLGEKVPVVAVPLAAQRKFLSEFLANNNSISANIIKTYDFSQYGKTGIPLKYSRKDFCKNINDLLSGLTEEEQNIVLRHFGLIRGKNFTDGNVSFDGILNNNKFENNNLREEVKNAAKRVLDEIEKFSLKNETLFEDFELKKLFDGIIKGFPEFTAVVGKEQHNTHAYSVDIHTLKVLQSAMNNPLYSTLSDVDKTVLKMSVLLHDIGKAGGIRDEGHANASANYAAGILEKIKFPEEIKDRIIGIIQNHHWFEGYNKGFLSAEDVAVRCRCHEDFAIYKILAKADVENVNMNFHLGDMFGGAETQAEFDKYFEEKMKPINQLLNQVYSRYNPVFYTRFSGNGKLFPLQKVVIGGEEVELRVLDLNKLSDDASLEQYGFPKGTTKDNVRFLVHMTRPNVSNFESVIYLTKNSLDHSTWSTSIIKPSNNVTYENNEYGFVFDAAQTNFAEAYFKNIASGNNKTLESFKDILFGKILHYDLNKLGINLTQEERQQLSKIIIEKGYLQNINEDIVLGDKIINQKLVYDACGGDEWQYLRNIMSDSLKEEGFNLNEDEYADLAKYLYKKKYLTQITKPNLKGELTGKPVRIGKHTIPASTLVDCLKKTLDRLFDGGYIQSECITLDPIPAALIAKVDSLEQCPHDFLVTAKKYKDIIPVIIQKNRFDM